MRSPLWGSKNTVVFWHQQWLGGVVPFHLKFALKMTQSPLKSADFDQYLLITSQPYELAKKLQISWIGSRPRAFQRDIDDVHTLPLSAYVTPKSPKLPKGWLKSKFVIFVDKNKFKSNKLRYKVTSCENFQQQSCSRTIPLSNGVYMLAVNVTLNLIFGPKLTHPLQQRRFRRISASSVRTSKKVQLSRIGSRTRAF